MTHRSSVRGTTTASPGGPCAIGMHRLRGRWEMLFSRERHGRALEEVLGREPVDVIVTDLRMPRMAVQTLLEEGAARLYPSVVRIVLSGHAELGDGLAEPCGAASVSSKPSEPRGIENVVERACSLQLLVNDDTVKRIVGKIDKLPSLRERVPPAQLVRPFPTRTDDRCVSGASILKERRYGHSGAKTLA